MSIQVNQVRGDIVELIFNPREDDLRVGESLRIVERDTGEGLVVQVIAFRMVTYPSLIQEQLQLAMGQPTTLAPSGDDLLFRDQHGRGSGRNGVAAGG